MEKPFLKVKKLNEDAIIPSKRDEDAGYDLYGQFKEDNVILMPGELILIPTGISIEFPRDWVFYIAERSGAGSKGIARRCGVIDSGYRGEIMVATNNTSNKPIIFFKDEHSVEEKLKEANLEKDKVILYPQSKGIAQGMLLYCPHVEIEEVHDLADSVRGDGAWGSSGK